jgi:hypothetical protein
MQQFLSMMRHIRDNGTRKEDRTGTGTQSVFGYQMRFDLSTGFPMVTTKKLHLRSIIHELLWFLSGDSNIRYLQENGVSIWNEWADENGDLGPVYGVQWRQWKQASGEAIDQIQDVVNRINADPDSRRMLVSIQHRIVCIVDSHGGATDKLKRRRFRLDWRRLSPLLQPCRTGRATASTRTSELAKTCYQAAAGEYIRLPV